MLVEWKRSCWFVCQLLLYFSKIRKGSSSPLSLREDCSLLLLVRAALRSGCGAGAGPYGSPALRPRRLFRRPTAPTASSLASSAHAHRMLLSSSLRSLTRRPPLPACAQLAAMSMSDEEAVMKLKMENDALEQEIMALTKKSSASELMTQQAPSPETRGIKVMNFGPGSTSSDGAGVNNGSSWCPPQCARRTVLGGFFTS